MSPKRLYVGNLSAVELQEAFAEHGTVLSETLGRGRRTHSDCLFRFVEYATIAGGEVGRLALDGSMLHGSLLSVEIARDDTSRPTHQFST